MINKFALAFVLVAIGGLAMVPMSALADTVSTEGPEQIINPVEQVYVYNRPVNLTGGSEIQGNAVIFTDPNQVTYNSPVTGLPYTGYAAITVCLPRFPQCRQRTIHRAAQQHERRGDAAFAATGNPPITGLGILQNDDGYGDQIYTTFGPYNVPLDSIIIRYTYMG